MTETTVAIPATPATTKTKSRWPRRIVAVMAAGAIVALSAFAFSTHQSDTDRISALEKTAHVNKLRIDSQRSTISDQTVTLSQWKTYGTDAQKATDDLSACVNGMEDLFRTIATFNSYAIQAFDARGLGTQCGTALGEGIVLSAPSASSGT